MNKTEMSRGRRRWHWALAPATALVLLVGACGMDPSADGGQNPDARGQETNRLESTNDPPKDGGKLVMGVDAETNGWNPTTAQWANAGNFVGSSVIEPLMTFDRDGAPVPWLAESITPKRPGNFATWIIKLKPNIKFHNGSALDATVVKRNLEFGLKPPALSALALGGTYKGISVIDGLTLESDLAYQWAQYPASLGGSNGYIMANEMLDMPDYGVKQPIGTGPFVFHDWTPDVSFKAKKNPNYWRPGEPHLDDIEFRPITDAKQRLAALRAGDIDMMVTNEAESPGFVKDDFNVIEDLNAEKSFVMLNTSPEADGAPNPLSNIHARRALAYATDRNAMRELIGAGRTMRTDLTPLQFGTRWAIGDDEAGYYPFDLQKARDEIEAYKKETGTPTISFKLTGLANVDELRTQQFLLDQWKTVGIEATINSIEQAALIVHLVSGKFQASLMQNYGYVDPDSNWVFFHSSQANGPGKISINFSQLRNPEMDKALDDARATDDVAKQKADYIKATKIINEQALNIWLYNTPFSILVTKKIRGLNRLRQQSFGGFLPRPALWNAVWIQ